MRIGDSRMPTQMAAARGAAPQRPADKDQEKLRGACQQFEAVFLAQLLQKMRETVPEDPILGDSRAKGIYYSILDWELAQQIARTQSVGIAEMLFHQLSRIEGNPEGVEAAKPGRNAPLNSPLIEPK